MSILTRKQRADKNREWEDRKAITSNCAMLYITAPTAMKDGSKYVLAENVLNILEHLAKSIVQKGLTQVEQSPKLPYKDNRTEWTVHAITILQPHEGTDRIDPYCRDGSMPVHGPKMLLLSPPAYRQYCRLIERQSHDSNQSSSHIEF
jgi:hypothetical protein